MENKLTEFNNALCDVRRAHRLIYSYQQRMMDLAYFIKSKLDFPSFQGFKKFSNDIKKTKYSLIIHNTMWAWDFLYSYMFEYHFGEKELDNGDVYKLSIFQYSDTGYFEQEEEEEGNKTDINSFAKEEESISKLLFILEVIPKDKDQIWNIDELLYNKEYASSKHSKTPLKSDQGNIQVLYSFPLERFLNEETSIEALNEFIAYCNNNGVKELKLT